MDPQQSLALTAKHPVKEDEFVVRLCVEEILDRIADAMGGLYVLVLLDAICAGRSV